MRVLLALSPLLIAAAQINVPPTAIRDGPIRDGRWHWIAVEPARATKEGWVTFTGVADVTMDGSRFHAALAPEPGQASNGFQLDGRIAGGEIRATELLLNTDANPVTVHGILRRTRFGSSIEERISFHGGQSGEASFLGLVRVRQDDHSGR